MARRAWTLPAPWTRSSRALRQSLRHRNRKPRARAFPGHRNTSDRYLRPFGHTVALTVFGSALHSGAAECATPVASSASRISMISLSDFFTVPPGPLAGVFTATEPTPGGTRSLDRHVTVLPGQRKISCPPDGNRHVRLQRSWRVRCHASLPKPITASSSLTGPKDLCTNPPDPFEYLEMIRTKAAMPRGRREGLASNRKYQPAARPYQRGPRVKWRA